MASYTMELRNIVEMYSQYETLSTAERIEKGRTKLFDFPYEIDSAYKKEFETNFIRKFYMREIGFETEGLFKFQLETWLRINMPYFNKLMESEKIQYDPLTNTKTDVTKTKTIDSLKSDVRDTSQTTKTIGKSDSTTDVTNNTDGTSNVVNSQTSITDGTDSKDTTGSVTDDNFNRHLESTTPDGRLNLTANDGEGVIEYASKIDENNENNKKTSTTGTDGTHHSQTDDDLTSDTTTSLDSTGHERNDSNNTVDGTASQNDTFTSDFDETEDYVESLFGKIGTQSYPKMVQEFRESLLRIEKRIFDEMQELFMGVY